MTRQNPLWQQASSYPATLDRYLINTIWPNGGAVGVLPSAVTGTMNVQMPAGTAVVPLTAGQGSEFSRWDATETVTVAAAPPSGQSRIDVVVLQVRDNQLDAGPNNDFVFNVVQGTPAASNPAVPATPSNALAMVNVTVVGAVVNLNGATITPVVPGLGGASGSRPTAGGFLAADTGALASAFTTYMTSPVLQNGLWLVFAGFLGNATVG